MTAKTLTVESAKHIAKQHGLTFKWHARAGGYWLLSSVNDVTALGVRHSYKNSKELASMDIETFYVHCENVACNNMHPAQMQVVIDRDRFLQAQEQAAANPGVKIPGFMELSIKATSYDKQVHAYENAIHRLLEELEEQHGTYAQHKRDVKTREALEMRAAGRLHGEHREHLQGALNTERGQAIEKAFYAERDRAVTNSILDMVGGHELPPVEVRRASYGPSNLKAAQDCAAAATITEEKEQPDMTAFKATYSVRIVATRPMLAHSGMKHIEVAALTVNHTDDSEKAEYLREAARIAVHTWAPERGDAAIHQFMSLTAAMNPSAALAWEVRVTFN